MALSSWLGTTERWIQNARLAVRDYRDLRVWVKAHRLTLDLYQSTRCFPREEQYGLTSQMRRSCVSIESNLAEGCGRRSDGEMARFVQIAMGSGAELSCQLLIARDLAFLSEAEYEKLHSHVVEVLRMLSSLSQKVKRVVASDVVPLRAKG